MKDKYFTLLNPILNISQVAEMLSVNIQTLRRWDKSGKLRSERFPADGSGPRFYHESALVDFLTANFKYCQKMAEHWSAVEAPLRLPEAFYCFDRSTFQTRLSRFELRLKEHPSFYQVYSLIVAIAGEIGNNSFDHNLGNWPDILGDRGQGILTTLKRLRPEIENHPEALKIAFTEIVSARAPENRGNGLKFVKQVVKENNFSLFFQSGDATLFLNNQDDGLPIKAAGHLLQGCFAKLNF